MSKVFFIFTKLSMTVYLINTHNVLWRYVRCDCRLWKVILLKCVIWDFSKLITCLKLFITFIKLSQIVCIVIGHNYIIYHPAIGNCMLWNNINMFQASLRNICLSLILELCLSSYSVCVLAPAYTSLCRALEYLLKVRNI